MLILFAAACGDAGADDRRTSPGAPSGGAAGSQGQGEVADPPPPAHGDEPDGQSAGPVTFDWPEAAHLEGSCEPGDYAGSYDGNYQGTVHTVGPLSITLERDARGRSS